MSGKYSELEMKLLRDTASNDRHVAEAALDEVAKALELPLREGRLSGDIVSNIYEDVDAPNGVSSVEFPLHYMTPGTEGEYVAFTVPRYGSIPQKFIQSDYVNVPVIDIAGMIDWDNKYAKNARWDVMTDAVENLRGQVTAKKNNLGWHTLIASGYDRGVLVADTDAAAGQFTTRLISLMKTVVRRNGGGNSSSINRSVLTDLYVSPEALEDMRSWNVDIVDEITRREIFTAADGRLNRIFNVNIHDIDELGEGQQYQTFYTSSLGGTMASSDVEIVVGLDLSRRRSFISPVAEQFTIVPDNTRVRHRQTGLLAFESRGYACLDNRSVLIGSYQVETKTVTLAGRDAGQFNKRDAGRNAGFFFIHTQSKVYIAI